MPKWGISKGEYFYDNEKRVIAKGLTSIKYMGSAVADELYDIAKFAKAEQFVDVLMAISNSSLNARQLDILIKLDFFSEFGNQRELLRITEMFYDLFDCGNAKKINRAKIDGTPLEPIVQKYAIGVTKAGAASKFYTLLDTLSIMLEAETAIKESGVGDLSDLTKVRNFADIMGYVGYVSDKEEDRRKLYVLDIYPLVRKSDGAQFGYSVITKSIGSGKESRFTVVNKVYNEDPINKNDIIFCDTYEKQGQYYRLTKYRKIY